jgi:hypothetical protein
MNEEKDVKIEYENITKFDFPDEDFCIEYNPFLKQWKAVSYNEEDFDSEIILEEGDEIFYDKKVDKINLFRYTIDVSLLDSYKKYI